MVKIKKAIIPAAGWGTRLLPASKAIPKEMLPIVDKPGIQYIVEEAVASDINELILITAKGKSCIEDHFDICQELEEVLEKKLIPDNYSANNSVLKYRSPVLGKITTICFPLFSGRPAI